MPVPITYNQLRLLDSLYCQIYVTHMLLQSLSVINLLSTLKSNVVSFFGDIQVYEISALVPNIIPILKGFVNHDYWQYFDVCKLNPIFGNYTVDNLDFRTIAISENGNTPLESTYRSFR